MAYVLIPDHLYCPDISGLENVAEEAFVCVTGDKIRDDGNDAMEVITHAQHGNKDHFHTHTSVCLSVLLSVCMNVYLFFCVCDSSVCLSVCMSMHVYFVYVPAILTVCVYVCLCLYLSVYLSIVSICL